MLTVILENLRKQQNIYSRILEISLQEQAAIVASDAPRVQEFASLVWDELSVAHRLEEERIALVRRFLTDSGETPRDLSLAELRERADADTSRALAEAGRELAEVLAEQKRVNDLNRDLLELHFRYITFMIDSFAQQRQAQTSNLYGARGRECVEAAQTLGILDSKI